MTDTELKPRGLHLHWPAYVHIHPCGADPHAHVVAGGCAHMPEVETILFGDDIPPLPDGRSQVGRFFPVCPIHGAPDAS